ncbi:UNKNOWN [Stylonychia lemnae]|uniref:Uncharacterized protein n=1 Tax=Stylonychia lemnae TaxID=5949 RepID=A0A077ZVQ9_STYLE|nr:UNKNOWN [Stylonychia lemnae]|eukprot:CDW74025.1 UNKNOWN [Stylonychia lemnae]
MPKPIFPHNLDPIKTFAEMKVATRPMTQKDIKQSGREKFVEFCILSSAKKNSVFFKKVYQLVAQDLPNVQFYYKTDNLIDYDKEEKRPIQVECIDKHYQEKKYVIIDSPENELTYSKLMKFVQIKFLYRNLQHFNRELLKFAFQFKVPMLIYLRDKHEDESSTAIDFSTYQAMLKFREVQISNNYTDLIFCVSDIKEGFHKDFFDNLKIYDTDIPLFIKGAVLDTEDIFQYASRWSKDDLKQYYHSEDLKNAIGMQEFEDTGIMRINAQKQMSILNNKTYEMIHLGRHSIKVIMFCSLFHHYCIDDLATYKLSVKHFLNSQLSQNALMQFYYMDSRANDNADQMAMISDIPYIRIYLPDSQTYFDMKLSEKKRLDQTEFIDLLEESIGYLYDDNNTDEL